MSLLIHPNGAMGVEEKEMLPLTKPAIAAVLQYSGVVQDLVPRYMVTAFFGKKGLALTVTMLTDILLPESTTYSGIC